MKKFLYSSDQSNVLLAQSANIKDSFFLFDSELTHLDNIFKSVLDKNDYTSFIAQFNAYKASLSHYDYKRSINPRQLSSVTLGNIFRLSVIKDLESLSPASSQEKEKIKNIETLLQKDVHPFEITIYQNLVWEDKIFGLNKLSTLKVPRLLPVGKIDDSTLVTRIPQTNLKYLSSFKAVSKKTDQLLTTLLHDPKYAHIFKTKTVPINWKMKGLPKAFQFFGNKSFDSYQVYIPLAHIIKKIITFNSSLNKVIDSNCPKLQSIMSDKWSESQWQGSLGNADSFGVNEAFYLLAKKDSDEGFVGLLKSNHPYSVLYRLQLVQDMSKAMLWHAMPDKDQLKEFHDVSKINVRLSFESVEKPTVSTSAGRIQAYIEKSKLKNALPTITSQLEGNSPVKKRSSKI